MDFEAKHGDFFAGLDKSVNEQHEHFRELKSDSVLGALALYLAMTRTEAARSWLWEIVRSPIAVNAKEQALICITWQLKAADVEAFMPYMLENSHAAGSLPYHVRNSLGKAAIPYLRKVAADSESNAARRQARKELEFLAQDAPTDAQK